MLPQTRPAGSIVASTIIDIRPPTSTKTPILLGLSAIVIALGGFGFWAATAPIASGIGAQGNVVVASKRKSIQHLDGGIVHTISVRDGDRVKVGDMLIELDDARVRNRYHLAVGAYLAVLAAQDRLEAERDRLPEIHFRQALLDQTGKDAGADQAADEQREIFNSRRLEETQQQQISQRRVKLLEAQIEGHQAEIASAETQLAIAERELGMVTVLYNRQLSTTSRLLGLRREVAQVNGTIGHIKAQLAGAEESIRETQLGLTQAEQKRRTQIVSDIRDVENRIFELEGQAQSAGTELDRLILRAPVSGHIVNSQVHTVGGVIRAGETIMEIVPERDDLLIEARIRPTDIEALAVGLSTTVKITAFKQRTTPPLEGRVTELSADVLNEPRTGEPYYLAQISVPARELEKLGPDRHMLPGMPAEVMINTGERTALAYLVQPILDSMHHAWRER